MRQRCAAALAGMGLLVWSTGMAAERGWAVPVAGPLTLSAGAPAAGRPGARAPRVAPELGGQSKTNTRCRSELNPDALDKLAAAGASEAPPEVAPVVDPVDQLKLIAKEAIERSSAVGASRWLAEAAQYDLKQTEAARIPTFAVNASTYTGNSTINGEVQTKGRQSSVGLSGGSNLFDGGKLTDLIGWRQELEKSAVHSWRAQQEAVVLEAITTVLERNRYRTQAQVYQQHARKMSCLVEALEAIVAEDKGRASELVQVRKNQAQAELSRDSAVAQSRQIELKLKRLLGDRFASGEGISGPLVATPDLGELMRVMEMSPDVLQLKTQAEAQLQYAKSLGDNLWPQLNWFVNKSRGVAKDLGTSSWQVGIALNYTLFDAQAERSGIRAALKRAEASQAQYQEVINSRSERMGSVHDNAATSFDRARRYVDILKDSDLVRNFTFQQWSQLGRRSLFDLMSAEGDHFSLRIAYVNSLFDGYEANAQLRSMGGGLAGWLKLDTGAMPAMN